MAKLFGQGASADGEAAADAEVTAIIDAFGGDAKAALRALIEELAILRRQGGRRQPSGSLPGTDQWRHRRRHLQ
ncbi:hypothetical protein [Phreatobacter sp. AB_2022a]|uniref:hypothetical protein n=1 Tax=Phreatobacter sp. AB_2022a TaxID=3003134 RepID=UPI0022876C66|nr:hypothetical protein [Phreatobacter sp. AB_2022a]MCZ0732746.1 hypothetical protein [Phreatobacter sp. AB_2022a]